MLAPLGEDTRGYFVSETTWVKGAVRLGACLNAIHATQSSLDIHKLSNHDRLRIMGGEAARARHEAAAERTLNDPECQKVLDEMFGREKKGGQG